MANVNTTATKRLRTTKVPPIIVDRRACAFLLGNRERRLVERAFKVLEKSAVYRAEAFQTPGAVREYSRA